jgi:cation diffusion facilitator CzcD-associated flavoprotein CzcO
VGVTTEAVEYLDVLIVGAGISGIGCAYYLQEKLPGKSYAIVEARETSGGTWDLFRYPGIRSDSDVHTFGYAFRPWGGERAIAEGREILAYVRNTAAEHGIDRHIRYQHRVVAADWVSEEAGWRITVQRADTGDRLTLSCGWFFCGSGYYRYEEGYTPELPELDRFQRTIVHPQHWPQDLDYEGKRVVVIGSGATAVTVVPAMARRAAHVTMLQRSPSYVISLPSRDKLATWLTRRFGTRWGYRLTRAKNIALNAAFYELCQRCPRLMRRLLRTLTARQLPDGYPVDIDFRPRYGPWDQRLCVVPSGDLFKALRGGGASIVTDLITGFDAGSVRLASGRSLEADILVTATGLNLLAFGGIALSLDGEPVSLPQTLAFRGMMLGGLPNFAFLIGYTNASWTLKVGPVCEHLCRIIEHMDTNGFKTATPQPSAPTRADTRPLLNFSAGYVRRALDSMPRQGVQAPWDMPMSYRTDHRRLVDGPVEDAELFFGPVR